MPHRARKFSERWPRPKPPPTESRLAANRFYAGTRWRNLRREILRDAYKCIECDRSGILEPATEVDHIQPLSRGGAPYDPANLQALCTPCHSRKTRAENVNRDARTRPQAA